MQRLMPAARVDQVRAKLGRFGFGQGRADVKAGNLSGGEKARLTLALITHDAPHLLVLDEPTNHLDLEARDALIDGLADYSGAVILVTHDRHMVELIADRLWLVGDGTAQPFDGDIDDYRKQLATAARESSAASRQRSSKSKPDKSARREPAQNEPVQDQPPPPKPNGAKLAPNALRRAARDAEARVATLTAEKEQLDRDLADPKTYKNGGDRLIELQRRQGHVAAALAAAETSWLEAAQQLEDATRPS